MTRTVRRFAAWMLVLATLFAQLSVAAYACPPVQQPVEAAMPCGHPEPQQPNLCERHCHDAQQVQAAAPMPVGFVAAFVVSLHLPEPVAAHPQVASPGLEREVFPPPAIRHCCLRI